MTRLRRTLARHLRTLADHLDPGCRYADGGWLPPRSTTMAVNRTGLWEPVGRPHRPAGGIR